MANELTNVGLSPKDIAAAKALAREGASSDVIRQRLGITPTRWTELTQGEDLQALLASQAGELAFELFGMLLARARETGDPSTIRYLLDRLAPPKRKDDDRAPRVQVNIIAPAETMADYKEIFPDETD